MAKRRMFSLQIVDTDAFLDMPHSSQLLYFHLCMRADDEGFIGNPKQIMRLAGVNNDDIKILISKRFILPFKSGVVVIKHWLIHNTIRMDRFQETAYQDEKKMLSIKGNRSYTENGNQLATNRQPKLSKVKLSEDNISKDSITPNGVKELVNFFFEKKGWSNKEKSFYKDKKIIYGQHSRAAKQLLELCDNNLDEAKQCISKISEWAKSRELDWSINTVFKKWYDIDILKPKDKKPYIDGMRAFQKVEGGKWYVVGRDGETKEYGQKPKEIIYK